MLININKQQVSNFYSEQFLLIYLLYYSGLTKGELLEEEGSCSTSSHFTSPIILYYGLPHPQQTRLHEYIQHAPVIPYPDLGLRPTSQPLVPEPEQPTPPRHRRHHGGKRLVAPGGRRAAPAAREQDGPHGGGEGAAVPEAVV